MVTGLRALAGVAPRGECELHLTCAAGSNICGGDGDNGLRGRAATLEDNRTVFMRARDIAIASGL